MKGSKEERREKGGGREGGMKDGRKVGKQQSREGGKVERRERRQMEQRGEEGSVGEREGVKRRSNEKGNIFNQLPHRIYTYLRI